MSAVAIIEFGHPNKQGAKISLVVDHILGVMDLPEQRVVAVIGPGSALVPVSGTHDEVVAKIVIAREANAAALKNQKGKKNK